MSGTCPPWCDVKVEGCALHQNQLGGPATPQVALSVTQGANDDGPRLAFVLHTITQRNGAFLELNQHQARALALMFEHMDHYRSEKIAEQLRKAAAILTEGKDAQ